MALTCTHCVNGTFVYRVFSLTPDSIEGLIVVSSHHPDPMNAFATMSSQQMEQQSEQHGHFRWFASTVFKYHLLLHDVSVGEESK